MVEGFEWAESNLGVESPHELQALGVNVFFAPNISPNTKVVDLGTGRVEQFRDGEKRPEQGYYADFADLERFCRRRGIPLNEVEGFVTTAPLAGEAGDPLRHGGR